MHTKPCSYRHCIIFCSFQKTLKELLHSYEDVLKHEKVVAFTCGLMKDPTLLVNHVYEVYLKYVYDCFSPEDNTEIIRQLHAQGKNIIDLFYSMYTESRVPLHGFPGYNQDIYRSDMYKGGIDKASKLYLFNVVSKDDVPDVKFTKGSEEAPECILWVKKPEKEVTETLLVTCCKISRHQPVNLLIMSDIYCKDLTHAEVPTMSKRVQSVVFINTDLALNFWQNILHQLFECVNL